MARTSAFENNASAYDAWFDEHEAYYQAELAALRRLVPITGKGLDVGVGTGRFAGPLGIEIGIEPAEAMCSLALKRGVKTIQGVAEKLPVASGVFDYVLFVTTLCFLDSLEEALSESYRILKVGGYVVIGLIDKESTLGKQYQKRRGDNVFYKEANFYAVNDVVQVLESTGFVDFRFVQTLFAGEDPQKVQAVKDGYGEGSFVVVRARRPGSPDIP